ncbi:MAG TPA: aminotransferase class I/II-fold pyridoxal phosphate-dependent enzyme [Candidatus Saccharimonadales bacterium]|jgi:histidinol-phosphate aminotransferase|nr:aminotransferase class I/II-fold pyridoxal phosphate-dependent enzyme [Candidatus Saccharimonadales bacterium]
MLTTRQCIREMPEYASPSGDPSLPVRLDLNENTSGCSPRVLARLRNLDAKKIALYAPREPGEKLAADFLGLRPEETLLTNGADEGIDLLCRAYLDAEGEMAIVTPAFNMYEVFCQSTGATLVGVPAAAEFRFPVEGLLKAITPRTRLMIVTNPNNPTGVAADRNDILRVVEAAPDAAVLVDEAYFDFYGQTLIDQIGRIPNLFVARTFSKAYGLAGMRIGILAGAQEQISEIRRIPSPFNLNVFALECLSEALADRETVAAYVTQTRHGREWLRQELTALGVKCWPSETSFLLADFGGYCEALLAAMAREGIALRPRPDLPGCIRITIGTQQEMQRVITAVQQFMKTRTEARQAVP